jgi:hypothetical protein
VDQNRDGAITAADRIILGPGEEFPDWTAGLTNRLEWRNLHLSVFATARQGVTVNSRFHHFFNRLGGRINNLDVDYWTPDNPSSTEPQPDNNFQGGSLYGTSRLYKDASAIRIRNITLGYTLPSTLAKRLNAESLRIYVSAQEPLLITNYTGFDPESGTEEGSPSYRTLLVGLSVRR